MFMAILGILGPFLKFFLEMFIKRGIIKEENAKKMLDALKSYEKSGTPADSQNAYKKILKEIEDEKKSP